MKIASVKNAKPSRENGKPISGPASSMKRGHSNPSSKERAVPETAPTANRIAVPLAHRFAKSRYTSSPVRSHRHSAMVIMTGSATPISAKMMWNPRENAICRRAARRSVMEHLLALHPVRGAPAQPWQGRSGQRPAES